MPTNVKPTFFDQLRASGLLEPEQLAQLAELPEAKQTDPRPLARQVFQRGWLTRHQINQVVAGRAKELLVGPYVLIDRLGEGGMGMVFKARHRHMGRVVALKIIRKEKLANPDAVQRFYREVRAAAQLSHPNIVLAYDAGQDGSTHFLSMEYVDGIDLARLVRESGPLPVAQACEYVRQAAQGLQHAHARGMVHRDIKPHNLLLTHEEGPGKTKGAIVKILDMGLALRGGPEKDRAMTQTGAVIGTPDYIAPEQAINSRSADIRADLYSLGCTFYFLLTGRAPFLGESLTQVLLQHQMEEATPLEQLRADTPPAVAAVVRKLMAKRPEDRFQTPAELAQVLEALARGETYAIQTEPAPPAVLIARKEPVVDSFWNTVVDGSDAPAGAAATADREAKDTDRTEAGERIVKRPRGKRTAAKEKKSKGGLTKQQKIAFAVGGGFLAFLALVAVVIALVSGGDKNDTDTDRDGQVANQGPDEKKGPDDKKGPGEKKEPVPGAEARLFKGHTDRVNAVAFSSDGALALSGGEDKTLRLWDVATGKELHRINDFKEGVKSVTFAPDGQRFFASTGEKGLREWNLATKEEIGTPRYGLLLSPDGGYGATVSEVEQKPLIRFWNLSTGRVHLTVPFPVKTEEVRVAFTAEDRHVLLVGAEGTLAFCALQDGQGRKFKVADGPSRCIAVSPDGNVAVVAPEATGRAAPPARLWSLNEERLLRDLENRGQGVLTALAFAPKGRHLISGGADGAVRVWDAGTGRQVAQFSGHVGPVRSVAVAAGGRQALSAGEDGSVRLWDLKLPPLDGAEPPGPVVWDRPPRWFEGDIKGPRSVTFSEDGRWVASADKTLRAWDAQTGKEAWRIDGLPATPLCVAFGPGGKTVGASSGWESVRIWDVERKIELNVRGGPFLSADCRRTLSPEGVKEGLFANVWDVATGKRLARFPVPHQGSRQAVPVRAAFTPDGERVAVHTGSGPVVVFDVKRNQEVRQLDVGRAGGAGLALSADGKLLLACLAGGGVAIWDVEKGVQVRRLEGHLQTARCAAFSRDGTRILSGGRDHTVRLWDMASGKELASFRHTSRIEDVTFSPDGKRAAVAAFDRVGVWDLPPSEAPAVVAGGRVLKANGTTRALAMTPDGRRLAAATQTGTLEVWALPEGRPEHSWPATPGIQAAKLALTPDGRQAVWVVPNSGVLHVMDLATGKMRQSDKVASLYVDDLAISPDGRRALTAGGLVQAEDGKRVDSHNEIHLWDLERLQHVAAWAGHTRLVRGVAFAEGGRAVSSGEDGIRVWDVARGKELKYFATGIGGICSPDGQRVLLRASGKTHLWDVAEGRELKQLAVMKDSAYDITFAGEGRVIVAYGAFLPKPPGAPPEENLKPNPEGCVLRVWDVKTTRELRVLKGHRTAVLRVICSADGRLAASQDLNGELRLWDLEGKAEPAGNQPGEGKPLHVLRGHSRMVTRTLFLPDSQLLSIASDGILRVWNVASGREDHAISGMGAEARAVLVPDGQQLLMVDSFNKHVRLIDLKRGKPVRVYTENTVHVASIAVSPDGKQFATAGGAGGKDAPPGDDHHVRLWNMSTGKLEATLKGHTRQVHRLAFSADGRHVVSVADNVRVWDRATGELLRRYPEQGFAGAMAISDDGRLVLVGGPGGLRLYNTETGELSEPLRRPAKRLGGAVLVGKGERVLFWGFADSNEPAGPPKVRDLPGVLWLCDARSGKVLRQFEGHTGGVRSVSVSPDGRLAASGSSDTTVCVWDLEGQGLPAGPDKPSVPEETGKAREAKHFEGHEQVVFTVALSRDGRRVLSGGRDKTARLWDAMTGKELKRLPHSGTVNRAAFSPDGRLIITATSDMKMRIWDAATGAPRGAPVSFRQFVIFSLVFAPDSQSLLLCGTAGSFSLVSLVGGRELVRFEGHTDAVECVAFSRNGRWVVSGSKDRTVRVWDAKTGKMRKRFEGHTDRVMAVAFSPDGQQVFSASFDGTLRTWDMKTGKEAGNVDTGLRSILSVVFDPEDGRALVTTSSDTSARLWDLKASKEVCRIEGHTSPVVAVTFSADGKRALTAGDFTVRLWDLPPSGR